MIKLITSFGQNWSSSRSHRSTAIVCLAHLEGCAGAAAGADTGGAAGPGVGAGVSARCMSCTCRRECQILSLLTLQVSFACPHSLHDMEPMIRKVPRKQELSLVAPVFHVSAWPNQQSEGIILFNRHLEQHIL